MSGQQPAAKKHEEQHATDQCGGPNRQKIEQRETEIALLRECGAYQEIRRRSDLGGKAAQQTAEGQRHQHSRRRHAGASRQPHDHRQHQHGYADIVHERRQAAGRQHNHRHQRRLIAAGHAHDVASDQIAYAGSQQALADDEHGPQGDDRLVAESGHRFGRRHQSGNGECAHHQQRHHIHAQRFGDEQHQRNHQDRDHQRDIKHQSRPCRPISRGAP